MTVRVQGLRHAYGDLVALQGVDFEIARGEVLGYLGPNGAGKSTTVRILLGLERPTAGRVEIAGVDVAADPVAARERIGYLPEVTSLYDALTPNEHLRFVGRLRELDDATIERRSRALFATFDLADRADEPIRGFSKGMKQKVAISLALLHRPDVLILDEPLSGLDAHAARVLREVVRGLADAGAAVLYCSHVLDVVERLCDRALILRKGAVVAQGSIEELLRGAGRATLDEVFQQVAEQTDPRSRARELLAELSA